MADQSFLDQYVVNPVQNAWTSLTKGEDLSGLPYEAQAAALAKRQKLAELLMQQGQQQPEVLTYKGIAAQPSIAGGLGKALSQFMGAYMGGKAEEDAAKAKAKEDKAVGDIYTKIFSKTPDTQEAGYYLPQDTANQQKGMTPSMPSRSTSFMDQGDASNVGAYVPGKTTPGHYLNSEEQMAALLPQMAAHPALKELGNTVLSNSMTERAAVLERQRVLDASEAERKRVLLQERGLTKPTNVSKEAWEAAGNVPGMRTDLFKSNSVTKFGDYAQELIDSGFTPGTPAFQAAMNEHRRKQDYIAPVATPAPGMPQSYVIDGQPVFTTPQDALARAQKGSKVSAAGGAQASEGERKAATLFGRMKFSQDQLKNVINEFPDAASPPAIGSFAGSINPTLGNLVTSEARQRVEAAQLDILDAALTLGTGAAYTKEQLQGYRKSYFSEYGDKPKNIADKKARLDNVIKQAELAAGRAFKPDNDDADRAELERRRAAKPVPKPKVP